MKKRTVHMTCIISFGLALSTSIAVVDANSTDYSFTMNRRGVNGRENGRLHNLTAGTLVVSGNIWVHQRLRGSEGGPLPVKMAVVRSRDQGREEIICTATLLPDKTVETKVTHEGSCGQVAAGTYWLRISKTSEDGYMLKGSGQLATK